MPRTLPEAPLIQAGHAPEDLALDSAETQTTTETTWDTGAAVSRLVDGSVDALQVTGGQQLLFGPNPHALCGEIGLSWGRALDLYRDGFLSFSPSMVQRLDEAQEMEMRFLGALARAGCDRQMLSRLLRGLSYPYAYDISQIYYSLEDGQWRALPEKRGAPETALTEWLDELVRNNDADTLAGIVELAKEALHRIGHSSQ